MVKVNPTEKTKQQRRPTSANKPKTTPKKKAPKVDAKKPKKPPTAFFYFLYVSIYFFFFFSSHFLDVLLHVAFIERVALTELDGKKKRFMQPTPINWGFKARFG